MDQELNYKGAGPSRLHLDKRLFLHLNVARIISDDMSGQHSGEIIAHRAQIACSPWRCMNMMTSLYEKKKKKKKDENLMW